MKKRGFSLVELIVVTIIIGILGTIAIPTFRAAQEKAYDNDARAQLRLIIAAEKILRMETDAYYDSVAPDIDGINTNLRLSISTAGQWGYFTSVNSVVNPPTCCAQATRIGFGNRTWAMTNTDIDPVSGAVCP